MALPPLPATLLLQQQKRLSPDPEDGSKPFLRVEHHVLRAEFPDGTLSEPFHYDIVWREKLDAVVIAAHYRDPHGTRHVFLRSALRPPVALRPDDAEPLPGHADRGSLWELPAGLVEPEERSEQGLRKSAARELHEELGIEIDPERLLPLGPSTFPAPGIIGERHFFFHALVDPDKRVRPPEDGSVLERDAAIVALPLKEALALVRAGRIEDEKTELGLRRLAELDD